MSCVVRCKSIVSSFTFLNLQYTVNFNCINYLKNNFCGMVQSGINASNCASGNVLFFLN